MICPDLFGLIDSKKITKNSTIGGIVLFKIKVTIIITLPVYIEQQCSHLRISN